MVHGARARWRGRLARDQVIGWQQWVAEVSRRTAGGADAHRLAFAVEAVLKMHSPDAADRCMSCSRWWHPVHWPCRTVTVLADGLAAPG